MLSSRQSRADSTRVGRVTVLHWRQLEPEFEAKVTFTLLSLNDV